MDNKAESGIPASGRCGNWKGLFALHEVCQWHGKN
jgi:hypothetical protein